VWNGSNDDAWAILLVAGKFLPRQNINATGAQGAPKRPGLPAVRDILIDTNISAAMPLKVANGTDGFERRSSKHLMLGTADPANGAAGNEIN
jgi:hypothetical protein